MLSYTWPEGRTARVSSVRSLRSRTPARLSCGGQAKRRSESCPADSVNDSRESRARGRDRNSARRHLFDPDPARWTADISYVGCASRAVRIAGCGLDKVTARVGVPARSCKDQQFRRGRLCWSDAIGPLWTGGTFLDRAHAGRSTTRRARSRYRLVATNDPSRPEIRFEPDGGPASRGWIRV